MTDLPAYSVRESARARRARLTVSARDGLVVVVPRRFPRSRIPQIVEQSRAWVERALERVREQREALLAERGTLPEAVELTGIGESWPLTYRPSPATGVRATPRHGRLVLSGAVNEHAEVHAALRRFARSRAAEALPRMLRSLAQEQALEFSKVRVRTQRTRWGSCSARGSINLNWNLAFLPPELVRHVMLHELVHTLRLDHSTHFRALLAEREPDAAGFASELRGAWRYVPAWVHAGI